ncbi:MAG: ferritin-like domain-containing protein [Polyangiales bacterium]
MKHEADDLRRLFRGILVALAVPAAGCSSTVVNATADAAASADTAVSSDVVNPPADVVNPPADVVNPPADVVSPPADVVSPPADVVSPPADQGCEPVANRDTCNERVTYPCGISELPPGMDSASLTQEQCATRCAPAFPNGDRPFSCSVYRSAPGSESVVVNCATCAIGRRTQDFTASSSRDGDVVGRYFAAAAQLEAASVVAFRTLSAELAAHGAPADLVAQATRAADEERRHARITRALARARGATPPKVRLGLQAPRGLTAIAVENAVEGCVRETFGALVAHYQRAHAEDPAVREAMDVIADDETGHAALAWSVAAWLDETLDADARAAVRAARDEAVRDLARELDAEVPEALVREGGMPPRPIALALLDGLRRARWGSA